MWVYYTCVFPLLHVPAFAGTRIHARQSITVTGNDEGYSPPSSDLHVSCMVSLIYTCSHGGIYSSILMYWPVLYLLVGASIGCTAMPCL